MKRHTKELFYYGVVTVVSVTLSLILHSGLDYKKEFVNVGSRFTGEDGIWLLEHSNIEIDNGAVIDGQPTPFRDFVNSR